MRVVVTRPEPDASALAARLTAAGHQPIVAPLSEIASTAVDPWPKGAIQCVAVTSRHAILALANRADSATRKSVPVFAVGTATAQVARTAGWHDVRVADGNAASLAKSLAQDCDPAGGSIVYPRGAEITLDLASVLVPKGFSVHAPIVYASLWKGALPAHLIAALCDTSTALCITVLSAKTAKHFVALCRTSGLAEQARRARYVCVSSAVCAALTDLVPVAVRSAERTDVQSIVDAVNLEAAQIDRARARP